MRSTSTTDRVLFHTDAPAQYRPGGRHFDDFAVWTITAVARADDGRWAVHGRRAEPVCGRGVPHNRRGTGGGQIGTRPDTA